jgi:multiple sugar transport system substrate-binding protein
MKPSPRIALPLVLGLAMLFIFSLCGFGASKSIEFTYLAGSEAWEDAYRTLTEAFEAANPDVKVERIRVQSGYPDRLVALIASGTVPDVIALDMADIMSFGDDRFLHDLNPLIKKTPEYQVQRMAGPMLNTYTVDGKLFAAPILANPSVYVYNTELFDLAGLAHPIDYYRKGNWTWSAFRDMARKITRRGDDGRRSTMGASMHLPRTWMASNGGGEFDDPKRPTRSPFSDETNLETLTFLHALIWQDEAMLPYNRIAGEIGADDVVGFAQGKVGMSSRWMSSIPAFAQGGFQIGLVPYPKGPGRQAQHATDLGMFGISITQQAKDVETAWRYVSYITGPAGSAIDAKLLGRTPPRPVALTWLPTTVVNPEIYPDLLTFGTLRVISRDRKSLQRIIDQGLSPLWNNTVEARSAATEIARQLEAFLKQNPQ